MQKCYFREVKNDHIFWYLFLLLIFTGVTNSERDICIPANCVQVVRPLTWTCQYKQTHNLYILPAPVSLIKTLIFGTKFFSCIIYQALFLWRLPWPDRRGGGGGRSNRGEVLLRVEGEGPAQEVQLQQRQAAGGAVRVSGRLPLAAKGGVRGDAKGGEEVRRGERMMSCWRRIWEIISFPSPC